MKRICGIYKITNTLTGDSYIGQSVNILERFRAHKKSKNNSRIDRAIQKYGKQNFRLDILLECSADRLDFYEMAAIAEYNTFESDEDYNLTEGGQAGTTRGYKFTDEQKLNMSISHKGKNMGNTFGSFKRSKETKAKMSLAQMGNKKGCKKARYASKEGV